MFQIQSSRPFNLILQGPQHLPPMDPQVFCRARSISPLLRTRPNAATGYTMGASIRALASELVGTLRPVSAKHLIDQTADRSAECSVARSRSGKNAARRPTAGRNEQTRYTNLIPILSANAPRKAAPSPATPKAKPNERPEIIPTLPGTSSWA